jgi:hypothetical protein
MTRLQLFNPRLWPDATELRRYRARRLAATLRHLDKRLTALEAERRTLQERRRRLAAAGLAGRMFHSQFRRHDAGGKQTTNNGE